MNKVKMIPIKTRKITIAICLTLLNIGLQLSLYAQQMKKQKIPVIKSNTEKIYITDNQNAKLDWRLDPQAKPDVYYVNVPGRKSIIEFKTDQDQYTLKTKPGRDYDFIILLNGKDSCHIRVSSKLPEGLPQVESTNAIAESPKSNSMSKTSATPIRIPFKLIGSRIYFDGKINDKSVTIQFDLGAGTGVVNKNSAAKLDLQFTSTTLVSNTQGVNQARTSGKNQLRIQGLSWNDIPLTEVGNMQAHEDLIIGNTFFRNHIIEIDYDKKEFILHSRLPQYSKTYQKSEVYYVQHRPIFKASFVHNHKSYDHWFLFDTGREGTMLIGEDFTALNYHWDELQPLTFVNGRKIVRLNAIIGGIEFKDIVTNAADPKKPNGRPSLFGNQVLNHFNFILDNPKGILYLKPNSLMNQPYADYEKYLRDTGQKK